MPQESTLTINLLPRQSLADYGTICLVAWSPEGEWYYYRISQLSSESQSLQKRLSKKLSTLEITREYTYNGGPLLISNEEINAMVQQLAEDYYQFHLQQSEEVQLKKIQQKRPLTINPFLPDGNVYTSSCFPMMAVNASIWGAASGGKRGWKKKQGQGPQFPFSSKDNTSHTIVEYNTTEREGTIDASLAKELWDQLDQFMDRDVDAFAIALAYAAKVKGQNFWVFGDDILDHRDRKPRMQRDAPDKEKRNAGHRKEDIIPYGESFGRLSNIWVTIEQVIDETDYDKKNKRRKQRVFTHTGRLLMIEEVWHQKEFDPETGETINGHPIGWKIRIGEWLQTYLEFPNEQIALLSKKILNYDPHNKFWEKRLAYYFFVHGHISNPRGGAVTFNREIEGLLEIASLDIDDRFPQRTKDRFEKAMNKLKEDGIIDNWDYKDKTRLPSKRWQELWLNRLVTIQIAPRKVLSGHDYSATDG